MKSAIGNQKLSVAAAPLPAAVAKLAGKTPIASILRSADWANMPTALRERAQFSAGVESIRFLQTVQDKLLSRVKMEREKVGRTVPGEPSAFAFVDRSSFIADLRQIAREEGIGGPGAPRTGDLTDIQSAARLGLIYEMQDQQAKNFAAWKIGQDPDVLDAFPAQELIRVEDRLNKRDWQSRWDQAGGPRPEGGPRSPSAGMRMIALKIDPVWENLSIFDVPWPPFDWGSGMGLRDVSRSDAVDLGLIDRTQRITPSEAAFNDSLAAGVDIAGIASDFIAALKRIFGSKITIEGNRLAWA